MRRLRVLVASLASLAASVAAGARTVLLGVPGRVQYDEHNGYCGEVTLQMLMLKHGAWIPQEAARKAGGGELQPGVNYEDAMDELRIAYDTFDPPSKKTDRYLAFAKWAKRHVMVGHGVVLVAYLKGDHYDEYDHVMPAVGWRSTNDNNNDNDDINDDTIFVHTDYDPDPVPRRVGDYWCTVNNKKDGLDDAGCVPQDTVWGHAILGPAYAGIGPLVELAVPIDHEPGIGKSKEYTGTVTIRGLQLGRTYALHQITDVSEVPTSAIDRPQGQPLVTFEAQSNLAVMPVTFESRRVSYFVCVPV